MATTGAMDSVLATTLGPMVVDCPGGLFDQAFDQLDNTSTDQELADDLHDIRDGVPVEPRRSFGTMDQDAPQDEDPRAIYHHSLNDQDSGGITSGEVTEVTGMQNTPPIFVLHP